MVHFLNGIKLARVALVVLFFFLTVSEQSVYAETGITNWVFPTTISTASNYLNPQNLLARDGNTASTNIGSGRVRLTNFEHIVLPADADITKVEIRYHLAGVHTTYRFQHQNLDCMDSRHQMYRYYSGR